jgi:hypothetical protein
MLPAGKTFHSRNVTLFQTTCTFREMNLPDDQHAARRARVFNNLGTVSTIVAIIRAMFVRRTTACQEIARPGWMNSW